MARRLTSLVFAAALIVPIAFSAVASADLPPVPSIPDTDSDTEGHESPNPGGPDHATARAWEIGGTDEFEEFNMTLAETHAEMDENGHNRGDASAFRAGPIEPATAHSDSREGPASDSAFEPGTECFGGDVVCLGALYASTESSEGPDSSRSTAESGILSICLLPFEDAEGSGCDLGMGFMTSESEVERDHSSGNTHSRARTTPAFLCFSQAADSIAAIDACGRIGSQSTTHSHGEEDGDTSRSSILEGGYFVSLLGEEFLGDDGEYTESESFNFFFEDPPESFEDSQGCPNTPQPNGGCGFTNQGESFEFPRGAASRQEFLHIVGWNTDGVEFFNIQVGMTESLARALVAEEVLPGQTTRTTTTGELLAFTGLEVTSLLGFAAALLLLGSLGLALGRRRGAHANWS